MSKQNPMDKNSWYFRYCVYELVEIDSERIALVLHPIMRSISYTLIAFGIAIIAGLGRVLTLDPGEGNAGRWFWGGCLIWLGGALHFLRQYKFDKQAGVLVVLRWRFRKAHFPLSAVTAVQVTQSPYKPGGHGGARRHAADGLNLLMSGVSGIERVCLTFHSDPRATRKMALRLADFLQVPIEGRLPAEAVSTDQSAKYSGSRRLLAKLCFWGAMAAAVWFVALTVEQQKRDEWDRTLRIVDATLIERDVAEHSAGADNWYVRGVFTFTLEGEQISAEGNLIPDRFYRENFGSRRRGRVPRHIAESMVESWEVGNSYKGYVHSDYPTHIFFDPPPSGKATRQQRLQAAMIGGALFVFGLLISPKTVAATPDNRRG
jgi:hypothetical protein